MSRHVRGMEVQATHKDMLVPCYKALGTAGHYWGRYKACGSDCLRCKGSGTERATVEVGPKRKDRQDERIWSAAFRITYDYKQGPLHLDGSAGAIVEGVASVSRGRRVRIKYKPRGPGAYGFKWAGSVRLNDGTMLLNETIPTYSWGIKRLMTEAGLMDWEYKGPPVGSGGFRN